MTLIAGKGIEGDRYMIGREEGFHSHKPEEGRQVTLFELETLVALKRDAKIELGPPEHRRNVTVEGVPLNHLVGRRFWLGETLLEATRLSIPCRHLGGGPSGYRRVAWQGDALHGGRLFRLGRHDPQL